MFWKKSKKLKIYHTLILGIFLSALILPFFPFSGGEEMPRYAQSYKAAPLSCASLENGNAQIKINFIPQSDTSSAIPSFKIEEFPDQAKTIVTFLSVSQITRQFEFNEAMANPSIEKITHQIAGGNYRLEILRKGPYAPAWVFQDKNAAVILLAKGDESYPKFSGQIPAKDSAVLPGLQTVSFKVISESPLKKSSVFFEGKPVKTTMIDLSPREYLFYFTEKLIKDEQYEIKAIVTDEDGKITAESWNFIAEYFVQTILGKDRFKYLGWWGQIADDGLATREGPGTSSEKLGVLSSSNRVKVLKEVEGEEIDGINLWYQIDGGKYPGSFVFSKYVIPMPQPEAPAGFSIPEEVRPDENWIDVDLGKKVLTLFEYDKPVFSTYISPGREGNPTVEGVYRVWYKLVKTRMKGGPPLHDYQYDLEDVPHVLFYEYDYAIHGTYWHDRFGTRQSAGCTNLTQGDAAFIFSETGPDLKPGEEGVFSRENNPGTVVNNHY